MTIEERNKKVEENLKLITYSLNLLKVPWNEDYFQQGVLELIRCVENYDESTGYKFSTYATNCIKLKLKEYIKRDYVIKPKRTGERGGKVYAPVVYDLGSKICDDKCKPVLLEDVLACDEDWEDIDLRLELENLIGKGLLSKDDLDMFIDFKINQFTLKDISSKYNIPKNLIRKRILSTQEILQQNVPYNYYEGG